MARFRGLDVLVRLREEGIVPLFHHNDAETAFQVIRAVAEGGLTTFEFTNRGDHALDVFTALEKRLAKELPKVILGVGTIVDAPTAALFLAAGACFVVSPSLDEETAVLCNKRKIPYLPGCANTGDIQKAHSLGVQVVKMFPGKEVGGPSFVKNVKAPMPWTDVMPSGGVTPDEKGLSEWFAAGVFCVGMGSNLFPADVIASKNWASITQTVKDAVANLAKVRASLKK